MLTKPKRIAICLKGGNLENSKEQIKSLKGVEDYFNVEWVYRSDIFSGAFSSYSQLINELIISSESEFMVFVAPKTIVNPNDISSIVDDLCNGFAFSSIANFGLFGATKELFRKIGLLDERFLSGEWEDNDIMVRLKEADLAVNPVYDGNKYKVTNFPSIVQTKGIGYQTYRQKWYVYNGIRYRTDLFLEEKRLPAKMQKNRKDISSSWKSWKESNFSTNNHVFEEATQFPISDKNAKSNKSKHSAYITLEKFNNDFRLVFNCDIETEILISIVPSRPIGNEGSKGFRWMQIPLSSNRWWRIGIDRFNGELLDIRIIHDGKLILNNAEYDFNEKLEYKLKINVNTFTI